MGRLVRAGVPLSSLNAKIMKINRQKIFGNFSSQKRPTLECNWIVVSIIVTDVWKASQKTHLFPEKVPLRCGEWKTFSVCDAQRVCFGIFFSLTFKMKFNARKKIIKRQNEVQPIHFAWASPWSGSLLCHVLGPTNLYDLLELKFAAMTHQTNFRARMRKIIHCKSNNRD